MRAILKLPGKEPEIVDVEDSLQALQGAIGGYLEHVGFGHGIGILCDEEGRLKGHPYNFFDSRYGSFVGPVLFLGEKGEKFVGLEDDQVSLIFDFF